MLEQHEYEHLLAIGREQLEELGVGPVAKTEDSDSSDAGSTPAPPTIVFCRDCQHPHWCQEDGRCQSEMGIFR